MDESSKRLPTLLLTLCAGAVLLLTSVVLLALLWRYVPRQAALLAGFGTQLPFSTRLVIAASRWAIRLLPGLIVLGLPCLAAATAFGFVLAAKRPGARRAVRVAATLALLVALAEVLAGVAVVHYLSSAVQQARASQQLRD
jgi:type II secretory pathway component PulF